MGKTLELNAAHPVVADLLEKVQKDKEDAKAKDTAIVLFQTALLESGYEVSDPTMLVQKIYSLMSVQLGVDPEAPLKEIEVPEEDEEPEANDEEDDDDDAEE